LYVLCFIKVKLSAKVKLFVLLLCVCAILPAKAVPEVTYTMLSGTLNPTHSLTHSLFGCEFSTCQFVIWSVAESKHMFLSVVYAITVQPLLLHNCYLSFVYVLHFCSITSG